MTDETDVSVKIEAPGFNLPTVYAVMRYTEGKRLELLEVMFRGPHSHRTAGPIDWSAMSDALIGFVTSGQTTSVAPKRAAGRAPRPARMRAVGQRKQRTDRKISYAEILEAFRQAGTYRALADNLGCTAQTAARWVAEAKAAATANHSQGEQG